MSLRLQILRMRVRVKKSISNLQNKEKVENILERVRQKKAKKIGIDISAEQFVPKKSITQSFKASLKAKIQQNRLLQKIKGFYTRYKDKYLQKKAVAKEKAQQTAQQKALAITRKLNINPALRNTAADAALGAQPELPQAHMQNKKLKSKIANILKSQKNQIDMLNTQTYCHDENMHPQSQNSQKL